MGWMQGSVVVKVSPGHHSSSLPSIHLPPSLAVVVLHPKLPVPKVDVFGDKWGIECSALPLSLHPPALGCYLLSGFHQGKERVA